MLAGLSAAVGAVIGAIAFYVFIHAMAVAAKKSDRSIERIRKEYLEKQGEGNG